MYQPPVPQLTVYVFKNVRGICKSPYLSTGLLGLSPGKSERYQAGDRWDAPHPALDRNVHPYMPSTVLCTGKATYKKQNGTLQLTDSHITFTPDGKVSPTLKIPNTDHSCLYPHCGLLSQTVNSSVGSDAPDICREQLCCVVKQEPLK